MPTLGTGTIKEDIHVGGCAVRKKGKNVYECMVLSPRELGVKLVMKNVITKGTLRWELGEEKSIEGVICV